MGFFSFLGKKNRREVSPLSEIDAPRRKRDDRLASANTVNSAQRLASSQIVQRDAARKTALKIDAIESEMSSELTRPPTAQHALTGAVAARPATGTTLQSTTSELAGTEGEFLATLPAMAMSTDFLLGGDVGLRKIELALSESAPVIDEAAILFANDQNEIVESMLLDAINNDDLQESARTAWAMLFDLYQITGQQAVFEKLAIGYASKFETSPPTWVAATNSEANGRPPRPDPAVVSFALSGPLDDAAIQGQLDHLMRLGASNPALQVDVSQPATFSTAGCALLTDTLRKVEQAGCNVMLVQARTMSDRLRATLTVGQSDDTEARWLLLLDLLQRQNRQQDFEDASIDYCVTFEVSPPAFVAPAINATNATDRSDLFFAPVLPENVFMMPAVVDGKTDLIDAITRFAKQHNPAIIDCKQLARVDFSAAGQLLSGLAPLAGNDRVIELHNVNQLVTALFNVMGLRDIARIIPRKE